MKGGSWPETNYHRWWIDSCGYGLEGARVAFGVQVERFGPRVGCGSGTKRNIAYRLTLRLGLNRGSHSSRSAVL
jgi:hypothetical protein